MTEIVSSIALVALSLLVPVGTLRLEKRTRVVRILSPVVVCYLVGIAFGNQPWVDFSDRVALTTCNATVALAIPLLLFSVDIGGWLRLAGTTVLSFFCCILAAGLAAMGAHLLFHSRLANSPEIAGMLTGVYIGGTPNMAAIQTALRVRAETFILLNAADMVVSFAYLLFILTVAPRLLARLLPPFESPRRAPDNMGGANLFASFPTPRESTRSFGLAALIVAVGLLSTLLVPEDARPAAAILVITSLAVGASLNRRVRALPGTHDLGQFLLLVFCVAMGFTTDFVQLFSSTPVVVLFAAVTVTGTVAIHFSLAALFGIDRDTAIITSTAGIFGPHMVGPVAATLKNREVLFSGLASGLVGYAAGNYVGMAVALSLL